MFEKNMKIINLKIKNLFTKKNLFLIGFLAIKDGKEKISRSNLKLELNEKEYDIRFILKRIKNIGLIEILSNLYIVKIPLEDLMTGKIYVALFDNYGMKAYVEGFPHSWKPRRDMVMRLIVCEAVIVDD